MQKICALWGHRRGERICISAILLHQAPGGPHPQGEAESNSWLLEIAESLARYRVGQQMLGFRRNQVSFRICTSRTLPYFAATPATLWGLILLLAEPCVKSTSHLFLPPCWMKGPGLHLPFVAASQVIFSARTHVLGSKCYSELFRSEVFPFCTWRTKCLPDLHVL